MLPPIPPRGRGLRLRRAAIVAGGVLLAIVLGLALLRFINLGPLGALAASRLLDRPTELGEMHIGIGRSISVELRDVRLANAPGGSQPAMAELRSLVAEIAPLPLLAGRVQVTSVTIDAPTVLLERAADGRGNWRFGAGAGPAHPGIAAPPVRAALPVITALTLRGGDLVFRTTSGARLHIELQDAELRAPAPDQPLALAADGAYNGAPIRLVISGQSMDELRDPSIPYGAIATARSGTAIATFRGTITDPLDFDGVRGGVVLDAPDTAEVLAAAGLAGGVDRPLAVTANLHKQGDAWKLTDIAGTLARNPFGGTGELMEGARGMPDRADLDVRIQNLDIGAITGGAKPGAAGFDDLPVVADKPGTLVDARITVAAANFGTTRLSDVAFSAHVQPGRVTLDETSLVVAGGKARLWASAEPAGNGTHIVGGATIAGADAAELVRGLGGPAGALGGRLDGGVTLDMVGATVSRALAASRIAAVVGMRDGSITRNLMELVSTDLRRLLRKRAGSARVSCLIGIANLTNGSGPVNPLRLRTSGGTVVGSGRIDLARRVIDMTIRSESASTGFFALDVPVRISGAFRNPSIAPVLRVTTPAPLTRRNQVNLPPDLQEFIRGNSCLR